MYIYIYIYYSMLRLIRQDLRQGPEPGLQERDVRARLHPRHGPPPPGLVTMIVTMVITIVIILIVMMMITLIILMLRMLILVLILAFMILLM